MHLFGRIVLVTMGVLFAALWISAHVAWAVMSATANLMANDSGQASLGKYISLFLGMFGGQFVAGLAGIPGGLAFFWSGARKILLILFLVLFVTGVAWQVLAFQSFFST